MSISKTYPLSLARSYVRHWGLPEAVRELLQNAIDSDSPFEYAFEDGRLSITSRYAELSPRTLLLGATSKAEDAAAIGSFGEGYKLALLVLAREGFEVTVFNRARIWRPGFEFSADFGEEMLVVHEENGDLDVQAVTFQIGGLTQEHIELVRAMCLMMQSPMRDVIGTPFGHILPSRPGKLYVGSLFVCDTEMQYGYDVKPEYLRLERDRQTVSSFDLKLLTERMWIATKSWARVCELLEREAPDVQTMQYSKPPLELAEYAGHRFAAQHSGKLPVSSQADADKYRTGSTVFVPRAYAHVVSNSAMYMAAMVRESKDKTPKQALEQWLEDHKKYLRRLPKVSFKKLVVESGSWKAADEGLPF